jgi:hypothetical protein
VKLVVPVLDRFAEDIAWIEQRMDISICDKPNASEFGIGSEEDLLAIALEQKAHLIDLLNKQNPGAGSSADSAAQVVDRLALALKGQWVTSSAPSAQLFAAEQLNSLQEKGSAVATLRILALALEKLDKQDLACSVIGQALKLKPDAPGLQKIAARLTLS